VGAVRVHDQRLNNTHCDLTTRHERTDEVENKIKEKSKGLWTFHSFGVPGEAVLSNGPKKLLQLQELANLLHQMKPEKTTPLLK
jgi:hypothetical protein